MKMTKSDLEAMIRDIVGKSLEEIQDENKNWAKEFFEAQQEATLQAAKAKEEGKGLRAARMVRALAAGQGDPERAAKFAEQTFGKSDDVTKALMQSELEAGGVLVPDEYYAELIELLRGKAVVRKLGARKLPLHGSLSIPRQTAGASASYIGESQPIPLTDAKFGMIQLTEKKLAALVPISNDLLRNAPQASGIAVDEIVREDLIQALALREDLAFIRGNGLDNTPAGIANWCTDEHKFAATQAGAAATLAEITADAGKMLRLLEEANIPGIKLGWIMTSRTKWYLWNAQDASGRYVYRDELNAGRFLGLPYEFTNQIPNNLGANGNESELYLADFAQCIIGENTQMIIDLSREATYIDAQGQPVSAYQNDQTLMRVITKHDFAMRHEGAASILTAVKWGA